MDIEKIKNFNQKVLALVGILAIVFLVIITIIVVVEIFPRHRSYNTPPQGLISEDKVEALNQENLRKQIISYETPWLIDTLQSTYIIPVSIKTLKKPEEAMYSYAEENLDLMNSSYSRYKKGYYSHRTFQGKYANLLVYNPTEEKIKSLFNERLIIGNINTYYFKDDILLVFYTALKDTDKNGVIDLYDLRNLCIYSFASGTIRKISDGDNQIEKYKFMENSKDILIEFKISEYENNRFDDKQAPTKLMRYRYESQSLVNIIPDTIQKEMQKLVEGK